MFSRHPQPGEAPPILEFVNLTPDWINWQTWIKRLGLPDIENWSTVHCNSYVQSVGKALEGAGVALVNVAMMEEEIVSGALVRIGEKSLRPGNTYHLCRKQNVSLSQNAMRLYEFLAK